MNIIYLHTHDLGDWLSVYGREMDTPNLDALAAQSTLFTNAHAAAPTCSPSRAALLTGQSAHAAGMLGLAHRGFALEQPQHHIANVLKRHGYDTVLSGIQHEFGGQQPEVFPYKTIIGQVGIQLDETHASFQRRRDREVAEAAADWLQQRTSEQDFFLSVGFFQPHRPFPERDAEDDPEQITIPQPLPQDAQVKEDLANLRTAIRLLDNAVGIVIAALQETGLWDKSIILFTTDHGIAFPLHKCRLTDAGNKVALMLRHPDKPYTQGSCVDALTSHLDVVPTLYQWLNLPIPHWCEGLSLVPVLEGNQSAVRTELFSEVNYHAAYEPMRSVRTERYCLIRRYSDTRWLLANIDDSPSKDACCEAGLVQQMNPEIELYDMASDPQQLHNLATDPQYVDIRNELETKLANWMLQTNDPLLQGHIARPPNSIVNHRDSTSPHQNYYVESVVMQD